MRRDILSHKTTFNEHEPGMVAFLRSAMLKMLLLNYAMKFFTRIFLGFVLATLLTGSVLAATIEQGVTVSPTEEVSGDAYFSATNLVMKVPVRGELFAVGETVNIAKTVGRSAFVAASKAELLGGVAYNSYIAAGEVVLDGEFGQDVFIVASKVTMKDTAHILGNLSVAAGEVVLAGMVDGNVSVSASTLASSAKVAGNVEATVNALTFTGGSVAGSLRYTSPSEFTGKELVKIGGQVTRENPKREPYGGFAVINFFSLLLFGFFILLFLGKQTRLVLHAAYNESWKTYSTGIATILGLPLLSLLFFATILGWRVGLLLIASYALAMLLAGTFGAVLLGKLVMARIPSLTKISQRKNKDLFAALTIGLLIPTLVSLVPYVGPGLAAVGSFVFLVVPVVGASVRLTITQSHHL